MISIMKHPHDRFGLEILVELISTEQSQSPDGYPTDRIEVRLCLSLSLARMAGLEGLTLHLDRRDFGWLCNARGIDRLSNAASVMTVEGIAVRRAKPGLETHITGMFADGREEGMHPFPVVGDPSLIPGFVHHVPTDAEKVAMLERFRSAGLKTALHVIPESGTVH